MSDPSLIRDHDARRLSAELKTCEMRFNLFARAVLRGDTHAAMRAAEECKRAKELQIALAALESKR